MYILSLTTSCTTNQYISYNSADQAKFQKEKIVEGINKLYTIESKIKEIFRTNTTVTRILAMVTDNKKLLTAKI